MNNEIAEGDKLIAEFDDTMQPFENSFRNIRIEDGFYVRFNKDGTSDIVGDLKYHTSWDWLMPVVEKIQSVYPKWNDVGLHKEVFMLHRALIRVDIKELWQAVIEFIKWYNKEQNVQVSDTTQFY